MVNVGQLSNGFSMVEQHKIQVI